LARDLPDSCSFPFPFPLEGVTTLAHSKALSNDGRSPYVVTLIPLHVSFESAFASLLFDRPFLFVVKVTPAVQFDALWNALSTSCVLCHLSYLFVPAPVAGFFTLVLLLSLPCLISLRFVSCWKVVIRLGDALFYSA